MKYINILAKQIGKKLDTNSILALTALFLSCFCLLVTSCTDSESTSGDTINHLSLEITPKQWGKQSVTRASYSGFSEGSGTKVFKTTFKSGDAIGFFAVDKSGKVIISNQKFTLSGSSWITDEPIKYVTGMGSYTYFAYYPYKPSLTGLPIIDSYPDITSAETFFASVIADWTPAADQSTEEKFTAQDLMVAKGINNMPYFQEVNIKFTMQHQMGLLITKPSLLYCNEEDPSETWEEEQSFTTNVPYTLDDKCYFFTKPGVETTLGSKTTTVDAGQMEQLFFTQGEPKYNYSKTYLTFIPIEDTTFGFTKDGLSYSLDNGKTWTELAANGTTPTVTAGSKIMWKNNTTFAPSTSNGIGNFSSSNNFDVEGNIMSLHFGDDFVGQTILSGNYYAFSELFRDSKVRSAENLVLPATTLANYCYNNMFRDCTSLTTAPELPATTLARCCYYGMFYGCTSLTTAPELPATTLANHCYYFMFYGCTSLTTAPELPATELVQYCYYAMFYGCTSLTKAPELPATTLANDCYNNMFYGCTSLTTAPELPATTLAQYCYSGMFYGCTSLTSAPELPATKLVSNCYYAMFYGCTSLSYVKMLANDISPNRCLTYWLDNVSATGTFVKADGVEIPSGRNGIPYRWTVQTYNP